MKLFTRALAMVVAVGLCFGMGAKADVLYEPMDDFYMRHSAECSYECRTYVADAPGGEVIVYESPENAREVGRFANGTELFVTYLYTDRDGVVWAQTEQFSTRFDGWFPLEYAYAKYDGVLFLKDFGASVKDESGEVAAEYAGKKICAWDYPGGNVTGQIEMYESERPIGYYRTFTDEDGRKWGYCGYYYGWKDFWICVDAPTAEESELYPQGKPVRDTRFGEPGVSGEPEGASAVDGPSGTESPGEAAEPSGAATDPGKRIVPKNRVPVGQIVGVLGAVAVVMVGSVVVLRKMKK